MCRVLLLGETGTGKTCLARVIHEMDERRRAHPFRYLNCTTITKTLAESQLFGHRKGAFSGTERDHPGVFQGADGGTVLLDEVGDLDAELQPKLLNLLQEKRFLPLGAEFEQHVDVRIISATNRPLKKMAEKLEFRPDLYQRISVYCIEIPPLRERPEDIEVQARYFLQKHCGPRSKQVVDFSPRVLELLRALPWPGNSRELENVVRETLAHTPSGPCVQVEDLPRRVLEEVATEASASIDTLCERHEDSIEATDESPHNDPIRSAAKFVCAKGISLKQAVHEFERTLLQVTLKRHQGRRKEMAAALGLSPRTLYEKLQRHEL